MKLIKLLFYFKKPRIVFITGSEKDPVSEIIHGLLKQHFKTGGVIEGKPGFFKFLKGKIFIVKTEKSNFEYLTKFFCFLKKPVLVLTDPDIENSSEKREKTKWIRRMSKDFPREGFVVSNFDNETTKGFLDLTNSNVLSFGFKKGSVLQVTDLKKNEGLNFKINYRGNIIPFWQEKNLNKREIYNLLMGICLGVIFELNFVTISKAFGKIYKS